MTQTLNRESIVDNVHGCEIPHLATADTDKDYTLRYVRPCSLVERYRCLRDTFCHHHGRRWRHEACIERYLSAILHGVMFHKTMCSDNGCIVSLHHLEWHFDGAACKNKYIIFSFQQQLLIGWASKPHKFTLRMAANTFLPNIRKNHVHYAMWNAQDDHQTNNLITQNISCK